MSISAYAKSLADLAEAQFDTFHFFSEDDEPLKSQIKEKYWSVVGEDPDDVSVSTPWSAVFVSWCVREAGATKNEFKAAAAHATFVKRAIEDAEAVKKTVAFWGRPLTQPPQVGDIIQNNRSGGTKTFKDARKADGYQSHSAIVIEIGSDSGGPYALTIGGNESDSVARKLIRLDAKGRIIQRASNPFICVLENRK